MAAPVFDSAASNSSTSNEITSLSYTHTLNNGSGNKRVMVIGAVSFSATAEATGATVGGVAATLLGSVQSHDNHSYSLWYILDSDLPASSGATTVEVSFAGSGSNNTAIGSVAYTEAAQEAPVTPSNATVASGTSISDSLSVEDDSALLGLVWHEEAEGNTPTTGQTERWEEIPSEGTSTDVGASMGTEDIATGATESMGWSWSSSATGAQLLTSLNSGTETINLSGTLTSSGTVSMVYILPLLTGTLTSSGALTVLRVITQSVSGVLTSAGNLNIVTALIQNVSGTLTSSGAITEIKTVITQTLQGTLTSAGSLTSTVVKVITLNGTLTSSGTLSSFFFKPLEKIRSIKSWILIRFFNDE